MSNCVLVSHFISGVLCVDLFPAGFKSFVDNVEGDAALGDFRRSLLVECRRVVGDFDQRDESQLMDAIKVMTIFQSGTPSN